MTLLVVLIEKLRFSVDNTEKKELVNVDVAASSQTLYRDDVLHGFRYRKEMFGINAQSGRECNDKIK